MRRVVLGLHALALLLAAVVTSRVEENKPVLAARRDGNFQDIPARVEFAPHHPDDGSPSGFEGDSLGPIYSNDDAKISIAVGRSRSIWMNMSNPERFLTLDLSRRVFCAASVAVDRDSTGTCNPCDDSVPTLSPEDPAVGPLDNVEFQLIGGANLDDMAVGTQHTDSARLLLEVGTDTWELWWGPYGHPGGFTSCPESPPVRVTRVDNETWEVQTTAAHLACLYRQQNPPHLATEYHGQFNVPFFITVSALAAQDDPVGANTTQGRLDADPACAICGDDRCEGGEDVCSCTTDCGLAADGDLDGVDLCSDCDDADPAVFPGAVEFCDDGIDNDCDGAVDCADTDCAADLGCCVATHDREKGPRCRDGIDNDCDGLTDGDDPDC